MTLLNLSISAFLSCMIRQNLDIEPYPFEVSNMHSARTATAAKRLRIKFNTFSTWASTSTVNFKELI